MLRRSGQWLSVLGRYMQSELVPRRRNGSCSVVLRSPMVNTSCTPRVTRMSWKSAALLLEVRGLGLRFAVEVLPHECGLAKLNVGVPGVIVRHSRGRPAGFLRGGRAGRRCGQGTRGLCGRPRGALLDRALGSGVAFRGRRNRGWGRHFARGGGYDRGLGRRARWLAGRSGDDRRCRHGRTHDGAREALLGLVPGCGVLFGYVPWTRAAASVASAFATRHAHLGLCRVVARQHVGGTPISASRAREEGRSDSRSSSARSRLGRPGSCSPAAGAGMVQAGGPRRWIWALLATLFRRRGLARDVGVPTGFVDGWTGRRRHDGAKGDLRVGGR